MKKLFYIICPAKKESIETLRFKLNQLNKPDVIL